MMAYVGASQPEHARKTGKGRDGFPHTITEQRAATWQREGGPRPVPPPSTKRRIDRGYRL